MTDSQAILSQEIQDLKAKVEQAQIPDELKLKVQKDIVASMGYSQMFASGTLERLKNVTNAADTNNWAWVMVSFSPRIFSLK